MTKEIELFDEVGEAENQSGAIASLVEPLVGRFLLILKGENVEKAKIAGMVAGIVFLLLGFVWMMQGNDFFLFKVFAPKYEQVRRETFEQSKAYNQGMIQELQNMQFEYIKADHKHKEALSSVILHRAADYPIDKMPAELRAFINDLKNERSF